MTRTKALSFIHKSVIFDGRKGIVKSVVTSPNGECAFKIEFSSKKHFEIVHCENSKLIF